MCVSVRTSLFTSYDRLYVAVFLLTPFCEEGEVLEACATDGLPL